MSVKSDDNKKTRIIVDTPKTISSNREIPLPNIIIKITKDLKKVVNNDSYILSNASKAFEPRT